MIVRVSSEEVRDVLFLQSGLTPMKEYISALREEEDERPAEDLASGVQDILAQMIFFITDTQENNPYMCEGIPRRERQKLMRELRIVDLLIDMIYFPFEEENGLYSLESIPSPPVLRRPMDKSVLHAGDDAKQRREDISQGTHHYGDNVEQQEAA